MSESKNKLEVVIGGHAYTLVGHESQDYMQKLAFYIDGKMDEIKKSGGAGKLTVDMMAILTSLNVADDYYKENKELTKCRREIADFYEQINKHDEELALALDGRRQAESQIRDCRQKAEQKVHDMQKEQEKVVKELQDQQEDLSKQHANLQSEFERFNEEMDKMAKENMEYQKLVEEYQLEVLQLKNKNQVLSQQKPQHQNNQKRNKKYKR